MAAPSRERFEGVTSRLGARCAVRRWFDLLTEAYSRPPRAYHDLDHLAGCLEALDELRGEADHPDLVELALWFHDAVYEPTRRDNEARSAALARRGASELGLSLSRGRALALLVMVTDHSRPPETADERVIIDADLAILGAEAEAYDRYEAAIRLEHAEVPDEAFRAGRAAVLRRFLERERIYHTEAFSRGREERARRNLTRALAGEVTDG